MSSSTRSPKEVQAEIDSTISTMRANIDKINEKPCVLDYSPDPYLSAEIIGLNSSGEADVRFSVFKPDGTDSFRVKQNKVFTAARRGWFGGREPRIRLDVLRDVFLPVGWPQSVSEDYTSYQIYDSLQAFSSTIAGLLSSRAVLSSIGVGSSSASPTSALLLHIAQDSTGRLATIFFAARFSAALEPETKRYRLLADIFNDISIVLDCASPIFPAGLIRGSLLATAGILRALCGVAAGASKASLSVHFASGGDGSGSVAELNAKDASQETVISLLGSLVGTFVVSIVTSTTATWIVLLTLLGVHLAMNTLAVRAVQMKTLNRHRANLVFNSLIQGHDIKTPKEISAQERIFERDGIVRNSSWHSIGWIKIGVGIEDIARSLIESKISKASSLDKSPQNVLQPSKEKAVDSSKLTAALSSGALIDSESHTLGYLAELTNIFHDEGYMLFLSRDRRTILIALAQHQKPFQSSQSVKPSQIPQQQQQPEPSPQGTSPSTTDSIQPESHLQGRKKTLDPKSTPSSVSQNQIQTQLKSHYHAVILLHTLSSMTQGPHAIRREEIPTSRLLEIVSSTKEAVDERWAADLPALRRAGWDVDGAVGMLETRPGKRYVVSFTGENE